MPYIKQSDRTKFDEVLYVAEHCEGPGELNYLITKLCQHYFVCFDRVGYAEMNEVVGVLECVKQEFYRRLMSPYEDKKIAENGDVYE